MKLELRYLINVYNHHSWVLFLFGPMLILIETKAIVNAQELKLMQNQIQSMHFQYPKSKPWFFLPFFFFGRDRCRDFLVWYQVCLVQEYVTDLRFCFSFSLFWFAFT